MARQPINPQSTFDYTTPNLKVQARPVSPFINPEKDKKLVDLPNKLQISQYALQGIQVFENYRGQKLQEAGQLSAMQGEGFDETKDERWAKSYWLTKGELDAQNWRNEGMQILELQQDLAPDEFEEVLNSSTTQYLEGQPEEYVKGFLQRALVYEQDIISNYTQLKTNEFQNEAWGTIQTTYGSDVDSLVETSLKDVFGTSDLENPITQKLIYNELQIAKDSGEATYDISKQLRETLNTVQDRAHSLGITDKTEVSKWFIQKVGNIAIEKGMPELLDFADVADTSGVVINQTELESLANSYKEDAERVRQQRLSTLDTKITAQNEQVLDNFDKDFWADIYEFRLNPNGEKAVALFEELKNPSSPEGQLIKEMMSPEKYQEYLEEAYSLITESQEFVSNTPDFIKMRLNKDWANGRLSEFELNKLAKEKKISEDDYDFFYKEIKKVNAANVNSALELLNTETQMYYKNGRELIDVFVSDNKYFSDISGALNSEGQEIEASALNLFNEYMLEYRRKNFEETGRDFVTREQYESVANGLALMYGNGKTYTQIMSERGTTSHNQSDFLNPDPVEAFGKTVSNPEWEAKNIAGKVWETVKFTSKFPKKIKLPAMDYTTAFTYYKHSFDNEGKNLQQIREGMLKTYPEEAVDNYTLNYGLGIAEYFYNIHKEDGLDMFSRTDKITSYLKERGYDNQTINMIIELSKDSYDALMPRVNFDASQMALQELRNGINEEE